MLGRGPHRRCRRFQLTLGIDEKHARRHDPFTRLEAARDRGTVVEAFADGDASGLQVPVSQIDEHRLSIAGIEHGVGRHRQLRRRRNAELDVDEHVGLHSHAGIGCVQANLQCAGHGIDLRLDVIDLGRQRGPGSIGECHLGVAADLDRHDVGLEYVSHDPHMAQVGDRVQVAVGRDSLIREGLPFRDEAAHRRLDGDAPNRLTGAKHLFDLTVAQIPELESPLRRFEQGFAVRRGRRERIAVHQVARAGGQQELLLGGEHLGAVDGEHRLPLGHRGAGKVHEDLLNPAFDAGVNVADSRLVGSNLADRADRATRPADADGRELDTDDLLALRRNFERTGRTHCGWGFFRGHRFKRVSSFGIQAWLISGVVVFLRVAIIQDLARRLRGRRPVVGVHRLQLHAAIGRDPRFVRLVGRMHRVDVIENSAAGSG